MKRKLRRSQSRLEDCLEIFGIRGILLDFLLVNDRMRIQSLNKSLQSLDCAPAYLANELHLRDHNLQEMVDICTRFKRITILEIWADNLQPSEEDEFGRERYYNAGELLSEDCLGMELSSWAQRIQKFWILGNRGLMNHQYGYSPLCKNFDKIKRPPEEIHHKFPRKSWNQSEGLESFLNTSNIPFDYNNFDRLTHLFPNIVFLDIRCLNSNDLDFSHMARLRKMKYLIVSGTYDCNLSLENFKKIPMEQLEHLQLRKCIFLEWKDISSQILSRGKNLKYYQGQSHNRGSLHYDKVRILFQTMHGRDIIICAEFE